MTQRKLDKVKGGMWEPTTGLVISGESSQQGALRELNIGKYSSYYGLFISSTNQVTTPRVCVINDYETDLPSQKVNYISTDEKGEEIIEERENLSFFRDIYLVNKEISLENIKFSDGEVIDAKYVTINEFNNMIKNGETHVWLKYFIELYKKI